MPNVQKDATCNIQQCWELLANNVASFCCSRSNDDGDFNENSKKAIGLDEQNNNFARASRFQVHFFALCHCTTTTWKCLISRFVKDLNTRQRLSFSLPELWYSLLEFNSSKSCKHLTNWKSWNKREKIWSSATSFFKWRFRTHRHCCCLSSVFSLLRGYRVYK